MIARPSGNKILHQAQLVSSSIKTPALRTYQNLAMISMQTNLHPAPFESRVTLSDSQVVHHSRSLAALGCSQTKLGLQDITATTLVLLNALLHEMLLVGLDVDGDSVPALETFGVAADGSNGELNKFLSRVLAFLSWI